MSKEELYKALKIFNREDLTYENDEFYNDFEEYMNFMEQEKAIEVFMSTRDMVKYSKLEQEIERLNKENEKLKNGLNKLLQLNNYMVNFSSKKVIGKLIVKQWDLIYELLEGRPRGIMHGSKGADKK